VLQPQPPAPSPAEKGGEKMVVFKSFSAGEGFRMRKKKVFTKNFIEL
jgi:hypothetical protein